MLDDRDRERYLRQIALEEVGEEGQERLRGSSVLIVGVGGLGSPIATILTAAGVGRIGIVDFDSVGLSNLPRQTLYTTADIGRKKVCVAEERLRAMNPDVEIESYCLRFDGQSAREIVAGYDIVVDGCDNMATRYVIDSVTKERAIPYVYGAISGFVGQVSVFHCGASGGYDDLFPREDAAKESAPPAVMATTPAIVGAIEANEVLKIAVGYGETLSGKLLTIDTRCWSVNIFEI